MRDYSKVSGAFWTGKTGKAMRGDMQAQIIALYLLTSPHSNMIGVFHCPIIYMAHETGCPIEGATKGLQTLCEGGFCTYDDESETVWVHEMAKFQIDEQLKANDKRVSGIQKQYANMPEGRIKSGFYEKYRDAFYLTNQDEKHKPIASPLEAPPKPEAGTGTGTEDLLSDSQANTDGVKLSNGKAKFKGDAEIALAYLNEKAGRQYRATQSNLELIAERMKEGASLEDCQRVIAAKCGEWLGDGKMAEYLRPATLFAKQKFWQYEGAAVSAKQTETTDWI